MNSKYYYMDLQHELVNKWISFSLNIFYCFSKQQKDWIKVYTTYHLLDELVITI